MRESRESIIVGAGCGVFVRIVNDHRPAKLIESVLASAESNCQMHLMIALSLWSDASRTWPRLYKILEEVEMVFRIFPPKDQTKENKYHRQIFKNHGLIDDTLSYCKFRYAANEHNVAGPDSRHALSKRNPGMSDELKEYIESGGKPMSHDEAVEFVRGILNKLPDILNKLLSSSESRRCDIYTEIM